MNLLLTTSQTSTDTDVAMSTTSTKSKMIQLLQKAGFDSVRPDTAQQISNYIIQQRINAGRESKSTREEVDFGKIVQKPISLEEITTHAEVIRNIINPPKEEAPRQTGKALAKTLF
jgi:hypothetical protein